MTMHAVIMLCTKMIEIKVVIINDINLKWHTECKRVVKGRIRCHMKYLTTTRPCRGGAINMPSVCMMAQKYICVTSNQCNRVSLATLSHSTAENTCLRIGFILESKFMVFNKLHRVQRPCDSWIPSRQYMNE